MSIQGALIGLLAGIAVLLVIMRLPMMRGVGLAERLDPYLVDAAPGSGLAERAMRPRSVLATVVQPWVEGLSSRLDQLLGGRTSIERRLAQAGRPVDVAGFRAEQVTWAAAGFGFGLILLVLRMVSGSGPSPAGCLAMMVLLAALGAQARDTVLTREVKERERALVAELPVVAELLTLAVTAGEGPVGALERVTRRSSGPLSQELRTALVEARTGATLVHALEGVASRTRMAPLARFVDGIVISIERGTPLADVLRAQAGDAREAAKRELLDSASKREVAMLAPVVFLVLPIVVLFALYPGFIQFTAVTS